MNTSFTEKTEHFPPPARRYHVRVAVVDLDTPPRWWAEQAAEHMTAKEARQFTGTSGALPRPYEQHPYMPFKHRSAHAKND